MEDIFNIVEIFYSVEGEGSFVGYPTVFVRLEGCNLRCEWCDTTYSYDGKTFKQLSLKKIIEEIKKYRTKRVCITGGEPLLTKNVDTLIKAVVKEGYYLIIETNGTVFNNRVEEALKSVYPNFYLVVSPKPEVKYNINQSLLKYINEFKFVVDEYITLKDILKYESLYKLKPLILQPERNKKEFIKKALKLQEELLKKDIEARVIPQCQKFMGLM
ncbi:MAG: 7-carboxy-7-deazaguanine synthase QueE [Persephonella sp.]|nr:MAG: 7-carboxy-7-deazaguanine synthase QueE [Persephonella sp.]